MAIGKLFIDNLDNLIKWYESEQKDFFLHGNWSDQCKDWEQSDKIGFYSLADSIPYLCKARDNTLSDYWMRDLYEAIDYNNSLSQGFNILHYDSRFVIFSCGSKNFLLPTSLCRVELFKDYSDYTVSSLHQIGSSEMLPSLASDISVKDTQSSIDRQKQAIQDKQNEIKALQDQKQAELEEFQRQLEEKYRAMTEIMEKKMAELNAVKSQLESQMYLLESEIYAIRCYTGEVVDFTKLVAGESESVDSPVVVYQKIRYLDEELAKLMSIYDFEGISSDCKYFEDVLKSREDIRDIFIPKGKSISIVKVSRSGFGYSQSGMFANVIEKYNKFHGNTLAVLVRNGDNLYIGWLDESKISIDDDNMFFVPKEVTVNDEATSTSSNQERLSRYFIFSLLQGILDKKEILSVPENVSVLNNSPYVIFSSADGWIEDNTYGSMQDIITHTSKPLKKGDMVLTMSRITRDDANFGSTSQYATFHNDRGRGEKNRTRDVSLSNNCIYPINQVDKWNTYQVYALEYPYQATKRIKNQKGNVTSYTYDYTELVGCPKLVKYTTWEFCNNKTESGKNLSSLDLDAYFSKHMRQDIQCDSNIFSKNSETRAYKRVYSHYKIIDTEINYFVSEAKTPNWETGKAARANFQIYEDEVLNLTFLNSIYLRYVVRSRNLGGWSKDYAYAMRYINNAIEYLDERERQEADMLRAYMDLYDGWQMDVSEWRLEHDYHSLTPTRAKAFAKSRKK